MTTAKQVFDTAMGIMDELSGTGSAQTPDTGEYARRAPAVINVMLSELKLLTGNRSGWSPVEVLDDVLPGVDANYAMGAMPYGLASNLLVDENSKAASFYQQRYEELRNIYLSKQPAFFEQIVDVYGGIGGGENGRW